MKNTWGKGVCDPHIYIFNDRAYLYASHDASADSAEFVMPDWWVWSSDDLVNWKWECTLKPEETYIGKPLDRCFATDAVCKNGKYYWVFSDMSEDSSQIGLVESDTPVGPWRDPLGKPLIPRQTEYSVYDPAFYKENEDVYLIFGKGRYFIAKMNEDMHGLAEEPRELIIENPEGPYGKGWTDDKPYLHFYEGNYYLSWGCFYAMSKTLYGPYRYTGCLVSAERTEPTFQKATWPHGLQQGRHGNFFSWKNQWYFTYCDMSGSGNRYYRDSWISYLHYKANDEMAPIVIEECGVGQYFAERGSISAANYFSADGIRKIEYAENEFGVCFEKDGAFLQYPNVLHIPSDAGLKLSFSGTCETSFPLVLELQTGENVQIIQAELISGNQEIYVPLTLESNRLDSLTLRFPQQAKKLILTQLSFVS